MAEEGEGRVRLGARLQSESEMQPTLIEIAGVRLHAYPVFVGFAFVFCSLLVLRESRRKGLDLPPATALWGLIAALFGARLLYNIEYSRPLWRSALLWENGIVYYGGLLGGAITVIALLRLHRVPVLQMADVIAPYLALGEAIGRIGCFLNGCCWGCPCGLPWAVRFPVGSLAHGQQVAGGLLKASSAVSLPVHPTQLYFVVGLLLVFAVLCFARNRQLHHGSVAWLYLFLHAILRFGVEAFRADSARPLFHMTIAQGMCLIIASVMLLVAILLRTRGRHA